jgi:hypothetical protein
MRAHDLDHQHGGGVGGQALQQGGERKAFEAVLRRRLGFRDGGHGGGSSQRDRLPRA